MTTRKAARAASYVKAQRGRPCYRRATPRGGTRSQTYLSGVETGKRNPSILVVERIAKALGVDVSEIFKAVQGYP
jgi:transcriptional regulator with XRE-family HTH domain